MIPRIPVMSDETVLQTYEVSQLPLIIDASVPLVEFVVGAEGYSRSVPVGFCLVSGAVHVHPDRLTEYLLRAVAATTIHYARHGFRSVIRC